MTLSRILPEFGTTSPNYAVSINDVSLEEQKLASFEAGYQAGWDDSTAANREAGHQVAADFAQNMADISMSYQETYDALLADIRPFLTQIVETVLPVFARDTLVPRVVELMEAEISRAPTKRVVIAASTDVRALLSPMITDANTGLDLELQDDATLSSGQVRLAFDDLREQELDMSALIDGIQTAVQSFFEDKTKAVPTINDMKETE